MASRFSAIRSTIRRVPPQPAPPPPEEQAPAEVTLPIIPAPEGADEFKDAAADKPLLEPRFLDAKVRLHRRLIDEFNLSAIEKAPEPDPQAR